MTRATLVDHATLKRHGLRVERFDSQRNQWTLRDGDGDYLMIASYGCIAPTQWEAVAEGLERISRGLY